MKAKRKFYTGLILFALIGQIAWVVENMYFNVFLYQMFHATASQISLMVSLSAVTATVTTVFIGALSDRVGKRKLFLTAGYVLWGISILLFAFLREGWIDRMSAFLGASVSVGVTLVIAFDCLMTFFGSTANDACFNAWITDRTDSTNRGRVEGLNAMMPLLAILVVFGGTMWADTTNANHWSLLFLVLGGIVLLVGILGFFLIEEPNGLAPSKEGFFANIVYGFRPSVVRENRTLYETLLSFIVFHISIQIFMPYLILYYTEALKMDNYVFIMAPAIVIAAVVTALYGGWYDRYGYLKTLLPSLVALGLGYLVLYLFRSTALVFLGSLLMMTGYLSGCAVFGARIRDCTPVGKAGRFQGLRIFGQVLVPGILGPTIGAWVLRGAEVVVNNDGTTSFIPNANIYLAALIALLCIAPLLWLSVRKRKEQA